MIRALLLPADINVLRLAADSGTISRAMFTKIFEAEQSGVEKISSGSGSELVITCGLYTFRISPWKPTVSHGVNHTRPHRIVASPQKPTASLLISQFNGVEPRVAVPVETLVS